MRIELSPQVADFLRTLAPEPRKKIRSALRDLDQDKGDILDLEHPLDGFLRLRVGHYRIIFHYKMFDKQRIIRCDFAQRRRLVYELFNELVQRDL